MQHIFRRTGEAASPNPKVPGHAENTPRQAHDERGPSQMG